MPWRIVEKARWKRWTLSGVAATIALFAASTPAKKPLEIDSTHYHLWTTAPLPRAVAAIGTAEILHRSWKRWSRQGPDSAGIRHHLRLFESRREMRLALPGLGWAEAIYHDRTCDQFDDPSADHPWHWLVHEGTHQLAWEDAHLDLPRWANEGLACLFGTSRIRKGEIVLGSVEPETYPTWWLRRGTLAGDLRRDLEAGRLVLPTQVLREPDGVDISRSLNAHYLSWWSMAHYFFATDPAGWRDWVLHDATREGLLRRFGPAETLDRRWYAHVLSLRDSVVGVRSMAGGERAVTAARPLKLPR